jgi:rare lipoprotein A
MRLMLCLAVGLYSLMGSLTAQTWKPDPDQQTGYATYYADRYHGRQTAYGEIYDRTAYTCASQAFPKNTLLRVTRLDNQKTVVVRVNDRGPWGNEENVIDLSYVAAERIDMIRAGRVRVRVDKIGTSSANPAPPDAITRKSAPRRSRAGLPTAASREGSQPIAPPKRSTNTPNTTTKTDDGLSWISGNHNAYGVQIAAYTDRENAARQTKKWQDQGIADLYIWQESAKAFKIIAGKYAARNQAEQKLAFLQKQYGLKGFVKSY